MLTALRRKYGNFAAFLVPLILFASLSAFFKTKSFQLQVVSCTPQAIELSPTAADVWQYIEINSHSEKVNSFQIDESYFLVKWQAQEGSP